MNHKNSFVFYEDWAAMLEDFPDDMRLKIYDAIVGYALYGKDPPKEILLYGFRLIQSQIDRDQEKYELICERNKENGKKGGRPKKTEENRENPVGILETQQNPTKPNKTQQNPTKPKKPDNDNDNENDNDNDFKENSPYGLEKKDELSFDVMSGREEGFRDSLSPYIPKYGQGMIDEFILYWTKEVEPGVMRYEKQKTFSIPGRLATWYKNNMTTKTPVTGIEEKAAKYGIDWQKVENWYRGLGLPLAKLTDKRKLAYIGVFSSYEGDMVRIRDALKQFSKEIAESDWLTGKSGNPAKDFEWFFNIDNFLKIIEGRYRNDKKTDSHERDSNNQKDRRGTFITKDREYLPEDAEF